MTMTQTLKINHPGTPISTWSEAVRVYAEKKLDDAVVSYLNFARKGRLSGFPVINLWANYDEHEQIYHAMSYVLEISLDQFSLMETDCPSVTDYYVELKCPTSQEMDFICQSLLYARARELVSITWTTVEYADKGTLLKPKVSVLDGERNDAEERIKNVMGYYKLPLISQRLLFPCHVVLGTMLFMALPENYHPFYKIGILWICGFGILLLNEIWSDVLLKRKVHIEHLCFLNNNRLLVSLLYRDRKPEEDVNLYDLLAAKDSLAEGSQPEQ